jgi:hypothetical protein
MALTLGSDEPVSAAGSCSDRLPVITEVFREARILAPRFSFSAYFALGEIAPVFVLVSIYHCSAYSRSSQITGRTLQGRL